MPIKYQDANDIRQEAEKIVAKLGLSHIQMNNVAFIRSKGTSS
jgi:predicted metallopeptidase